MSLFSATLTLLLVMDPLGNIPLFMTALRTVPRERRWRVIIREQLIALLIMVVFLFAGAQLLRVLHISSATLSIGGGMILFLIAIRMIFPTPGHNLKEPVIDEPFIVPLAIPYTAGPSLLATEILLVSNEPDRWPWWLAAVGIAWVISAVILLCSGILQRYLGDRFLVAIERLMGMILILMSTQMLLDGIQQFLAG